MKIWEAIVLAIIEGLTEFLPVSSTGHLILCASALGLDPANAFLKLFTIAIQFGAILSVVVLYLKRFFQSINFYLKLVVAFIPAAVFGVLFSHKIDALLESPMGVAIALLIGGFILLGVDKWFPQSTATSTEEISYSQALKIGLFQPSSTCSKTIYYTPGSTPSLEQECLPPPTGWYSPPPPAP